MHVYTAFCDLNNMLYSGVLHLHHMRARVCVCVSSLSNVILKPPNNSNRVFPRIATGPQGRPGSSGPPSQSHRSRIIVLHPSHGYIRSQPDRLRVVSGAGDRARVIFWTVMVSQDGTRCGGMMTRDGDPDVPGRPWGFGAILGKTLLLFCVALKYDLCVCAL